MDKSDITKTNQHHRDILVIDDNPASLQLLMDILNKAGYHVRPAPNGIIALRSVEFKPPDLILLDVKMPDMDGFEVCRRLKSNEKSREIPVLFISGLGDTTQKVLGFQAGGVDYITKPYETEEVLARVNTHMRLRELTGQLEQKVEERTGELIIANQQLLKEFTVRKEAERNLVLLNFAIDNVYEAIFLIDQNARFQFVNEESCRILAYSRSELLGKSIPDIDLDFTMNRWPDHWNELKIKHSMTFESHHKAKDNRVFPVEINANYFEFDNQNYIMYLVRDITDRKLNEQALHRSNRELRAISKCNQILMRSVDEQILLNNICQIICDDAGYRMAWVGYADNDQDRSIRPVAWAGAENGYLKEISELDLSPSATIIQNGKSVFINDLTAEPKAALWWDSVSKYGYRSSIALPLNNESGHTFGVLNIYSSEPNIFTPDEIRLMEELAGDLAFGIVTLRTRAQRKKAESQKEEAIEAMRQAKEQAEAANRYKTEFLTNISHELRTPLNAILGFAYILKSVHMAEEYQKSVDFINERGKHLLALVENILDFSKMELGKTELNYEEFNLKDLLENSVALARVKARGKDLNIMLLVEGVIPRLQGDTLRLQQIVDSLLSNAVKYSEHGKIKIIAKPDDIQPDEKKFRVRISVKDTGIGIPVEKLPYIFDPFSRFHEFYKGKEFKGMGLGLHIVKRLVQLMGGDVHVASDIGKGSEFILTLDFDKAER